MKPISRLSPDLLKLASEVKKKLTEIIPKVIAVEGQIHFEKSFDNQGFTDRATRKWKGRKFGGNKTKRDGTATKAYKEFLRKDKGRAILVSHQGDKKGTHLKDSIRSSHTTKQVAFSTDKEYAQVHNEGGHAGRGAGFEMTQRQFIGPSEKLNERIDEKIEAEMDKFFNQLKI